MLFLRSVSDQADKLKHSVHQAVSEYCPYYFELLFTGLTNCVALCEPFVFVRHLIKSP